MQAPDVKSVVPFFQPIIETAQCGVFGYEVLARENRDGRIYSLGPYFENPAVSDRDKLALDEHVRERAFEAYAASGGRGKLFMNLKPSWVYAHKNEYGALPTLRLLERYHIDPRNIVIEITEEDLSGDSAVLGHLLAEYRKAGCMLAIDDFGKGSSNMERVAYLTPDIIKIDHSIVRKMDTHQSFYELSKALSGFGAVSGFDLLFEGIETPFQLERCLMAGWCYLQGYIFAPAMPGFETEYANEKLLADILSMQNLRRTWNIKCRDAVFSTMKQTVAHLFASNAADTARFTDMEAFSRFARHLPYYCVRCFVCDDSGKQLSPVCHLGSGNTVTTIPGEIASGPANDFFAHALSVLHGGEQGYLSKIHKDVATKECVATYMHRMDQDKLLCVDIMATAFSEW